jgi:hypothetical protein
MSQASTHNTHGVMMTQDDRKKSATRRRDDRKKSIRYRTQLEHLDLFEEGDEFDHLPVRIRAREQVLPRIGT